jgi:probable HAF family extracellular repeat protein
MRLFRLSAGLSGATLLLVTGLGLAPRAFAASYALTTFDVPGAANGTVPNGINDAGEIVGSFTDASSVTHGFVQTGATYTTFDVPSASNTSALGINNAAQIVGDFADSVGVHSFIYDGTTFTTFDVPGATPGNTQASGINDSGVVVGSFCDGSGRHGYIYDGTTFHD